MNQKSLSPFEIIQNDIAKRLYRTFESQDIPFPNATANTKNYYKQKARDFFMVDDDNYYNVNKLEEDIKDYKRMHNHVKVLADELNIQVNLTSQYGIESTLPKAKRNNNSNVENYVVRNEMKIKQLTKMQNKIKRLDIAASRLSDTKEIILLESMLNDMSMTEISKVMDMSRSYMHEVKK